MKQRKGLKHMISDTTELKGGKTTDESRGTRDEGAEGTPGEGTRPTGELRQVAVEEIEVEYNPRKIFDAGKMEELKASIEARGIVQPLICRIVAPKYRLKEPDLVNSVWAVVTIATNEWKDFYGKNAGAEARAYLAEVQPLPYTLVAGERRLRCAGELGLKTVPCLVKVMTDAEVAAVQDVENLVRENLSALEEGENIAKRVADLMAEGKTKADAVEVLKATYGKERAWVYQRLALAKCPPVVRAALESGKIEMSVADLVARIPVAKLQEECLKELLKGGEEDPEVKPGGETDWTKRTPRPLSFREAKALIYRRYMLDLTKAPFDGENAKLVEAAGACKACPKRTGNAKEMFPDVKNPMICTDPQCWAAKEAANTRGAIELLKQEGKQVLSVEETAKVFNEQGYMIGREDYVRAVEFKNGQQIGDLVKRIPKGERPKPVIAIVDNQQVELFVKKDVEDLFRKHELVAVKAKAEKPAKSKQDEELDKAIDRKIRTEILDAVKAKKLVEADLLDLVVAFLCRHCDCDDDVIMTPGLAKALNSGGMDNTMKAVKKLRDGKYQTDYALIVDVMMADFGVSTYAEAGGRVDPVVGQIAGMCKVDTKAIIKAVTEEKKKGAVKTEKKPSWRKVNLVSKKNGSDEWMCDGCGKKAVRATLDWTPPLCKCTGKARQEAIEKAKANAKTAKASKPAKGMDER